MIREFISCCEAQTIRLTIRPDQIHTRDLGLFSAIFGVAGYLERFAMSTQEAAIAFVEPFRRSPNMTCGRAAAFHAPAEHFHAVGEVFLFCGMHRLPIASAADVGESGT